MKTKPMPSTPARHAEAASLNDDAALYERIRSLVLAARQRVARGIDLVQVHTSFEIGRHIVLHEQQGQARAAYGRLLLDRLAQRLTAEFGRGFSRSNVAYMRSFVRPTRTARQLSRRRLDNWRTLATSQHPSA